MARKAALGFLAVAAPLLLAVSFFDAPWADWVTAALVGAFPIILMALGAGGRQGSGSGRLSSRLAAWLVALLVLVEGSLLGSLALSSEPGRGLWLGGFPAATALMIYGLGVAALLVSGIAYAATFEEPGSSPPGPQRPREDRSVAAVEATGEHRAAGGEDR